MSETITTMAQFWAEAKRMDPEGWAKNQAAKSEQEALRKDAERYRWLREHINGERWNMLFDDCGRNPLDRVELDRAVDAEMSIAPAVG